MINPNPQLSWAKQIIYPCTKISSGCDTYNKTISYKFVPHNPFPPGSIEIPQSKNTLWTLGPLKEFLTSLSVMSLLCCVLCSPVCGNKLTAIHTCFIVCYININLVSEEGCEENTLGQNDVSFCYYSTCSNLVHFSKDIYLFE